ncbi:hypothetical protein ScPMuIL_014587 [Solemya velum]
MEASLFTQVKATIVCMVLWTCCITVSKCAGPTITGDATAKLTKVENARLIPAYTVTAGDDETLVYSFKNTVTGLAIDGTTGVITATADITNVANLAYQLVVTDGAEKSAEKSITVTFFDNVNPPVIGGTLTASVDEDVVVGSEVTTAFTVTDDDADDDVTYELGPDVSDFSIGVYDGKIKTAAALDYETTKTYTFNIVVKDSKGTEATASFSINVIAVNEHDPTWNDFVPEYTDENTTIITINEDAANNYPIFTMNAEDKDEGTGGTLTYSVVSATDSESNDVSEKFELNGQKVQKADTFDFDSGTGITHFDVVVKVEDDGGKQIERTVRVGLAGVNDNDPECKPKTFNKEVSATAAVDDEVQALSCSDDDVGVGHALTYTFSSGNGDAFFKINNIGVIQVNKQLSPTSTPYTLVVEASDGTNTDSVTVTVSVVGVISNGNPPVWGAFDPVYVAGPTPYSVAENLPAGQTIVTIAATDADSGTDGQIAFSIVSVTSDDGTTDADVSTHFSLDGSVLKTSSLLDRETTAYYDVVLKAADGGDPSKSIERTVKVTITGVNDHNPSCDPKEYSKKVAIDAAVGYEVAKLTCSDADVDVGGTLHYTFASGNSDDKFTVTTSGSVQVKVAPTFASGPYTLVVEVSDGTNKDTVTVNVLEVNTHTPVWGIFDPVYTDATTVIRNIPEISVVDTSIVTLVADDDDSGDEGTVTITIESATASDGSNSGANFKIVGSVLKTAGLLDADSGITYHDVVIKAADSGTPSKSVSRTVRVGISKINEFDPVCDPARIEESIPANAGIDTEVGKLSCNDADIGESLRYSITNGNDDDKFKIDGNSGLIQVKATLVLGSSPYNLVAQASDGFRTADVAVVVTVLEITPNDATPVWGDFDPAYVAAPTPYSVAENLAAGQTIVTIAATDADSGTSGEITYSIISVTSDSGETDSDDSSHFTLDGTVLKTSAQLDRETAEYYNVVLRAEDGGAPSKAVDRTVKIAVTDVNDNNPSCDPETYNKNVASDAAIGYEVMTLYCPDADPSDTVAYAVASGADGKFHVVQSSLKVKAELPATQSYVVKVDAHDGTHTATVTVSIAVTSSAPAPYAATIYTLVTMMLLKCTTIILSL